MIEIYKEKPIHGCVGKGGDDGMEMDEVSMAIHSQEGGNMNMEERITGGSMQLSYVGETLVVY